MGSLIQSAGWSMLGLFWAWVKAFMLSIGIPGLIVLACGAILLVTASVKSLKFVQTGKGMSLTAAVMLAALAWMWLMYQPAGAKTRPIAPASLMAKASMPSPILASKAAPVVAPVIKPPVELEATRPAPIAAQASPNWWVGFPLVATEAARGFVSALPPALHLPPAHHAAPAHAPAHHAHAPVVSHETHSQHAAAVVSPSRPPTAGHSTGRVGGSLAANNHRGGQAMAGSAREAARQRNMQALGHMGAMNLNPFTGMPHFSGGHMGGMGSHMGGGHMGGMSHHGGHH